jgi:hypothetical protein
MLRRRHIIGILSFLPFFPKPAVASEVPQLGVPQKIWDELLEQKLQDPEGLVRLMHYATLWLKEQTANRGGLRNVPNEVGYARVLRVMEAATARLNNAIRTDVPQSLREQATEVFHKGYDECIKAQGEPHMSGKWPTSLTLTIDFEYAEGYHLVSRPTLKL